MLVNSEKNEKLLRQENEELKKRLKEVEAKATNPSELATFLLEETNQLKSRNSLLNIRYESLHRSVRNVESNTKASDFVLNEHLEQVKELLKQIEQLEKETAVYKGKITEQQIQNDKERAENVKLVNEIKNMRQRFVDAEVENRQTQQDYEEECEREIEDLEEEIATLKMRLEEARQKEEALVRKLQEDASKRPAVGVGEQVRDLIRINEELIRRIGQLEREKDHFITLENKLLLREKDLQSLQGRLSNMRKSN